MTDDQGQYPTWGDLAREQVERHGLLYFGTAQEDIRSRLQRLPSEARQAFAVACAARLMAEHESLPLSEQRPFTLGWRPVLDLIWSGLAGQREAAVQRVSEALQAFHASPYDHEGGQDGVGDADEDAAAAARYAAECFQTAAVEPALWAASCAVDAAFRVAQDDLHLTPGAGEPAFITGPRSFAREAMHPAVQAELQKQLADLDVLEQVGVTASSLERLKEHARHGLQPISPRDDEDTRASPPA